MLSNKIITAPQGCSAVMEKYINAHPRLCCRKRNRLILEIHITAAVDTHMTHTTPHMERDRLKYINTDKRSCCHLVENYWGKNRLLCFSLLMAKKYTGSFTVF